MEYTHNEVLLKHKEEQKLAVLQENECNGRAVFCDKKARQNNKCTFYFMYGNNRKKVFYQINDKALR